MGITIDKSFQRVFYSEVCAFCKHLTDPSNQSCEAFPDGIPTEIWNGKNDHRQAVAGDHGIRFEPKQ